MSYRRNKRKLKARLAELEPKTFEIISRVSGRVVAHADSIDEVLNLAQDYRANPDLVFSSFDSLGQPGQEWTIGEVLDGTFEADLSLNPKTQPESEKINGTRS